MSKCFVIMPISTPDQLVAEYGNDKEHFDHVLEHLFRPAIERLGHELLPPTASGSDVIHAEIIQRLETADLVLCDLSTLNPNVFFELGIRTALDKPVSIVKDCLTTTVPFDMHLINNWTYDRSLAPWILENQISALHEHLLKSLNRSDGKNNLWQVFGLTSRATRAEGGDQDTAKLDLILDLLQRMPDASSLKRGLEPTTPSDQFFGKAQEVAGALGAVLSVGKVKENRIELNLGPFRLPESHVKQIIELGAQYDLEVKILGQWMKSNKPIKRRPAAED